MRHTRLIAAFFLAATCAAPAAARINMLEPWSPGLDTRIPTDSWNHDAHLRAGFGRHDVDFFELGYLLSTPLSPEWEVGGGLNFLSVDGPGGGESGFGDILMGAKYRVPQGMISPALDIIAEGGITLPTGDGEKGLGAGGFGLFTGGSLQGAMADNVTGFAHLGFRYYMEGDDVDLGEVIEYAFGVKYRVNPEIIAVGEIKGFNHGGDEYFGFKGESYSEIYLAPGVVFRPKGSHFDCLGSILLGLTDDSFDFGLQAAVKF